MNSAWLLLLALSTCPHTEHLLLVSRGSTISTETPPIQQRLKKLGVIDASATGFLYDLGDAYLKNRGKDEMKYMWPHRSLINQGIHAPGHSDASICNPNPWLGIYSLVTRKTSSGQTLYAKEGIKRIEAIRAYTIDGAYASWEENIKGSIEPGKLADLCVLDRDPLKVPSGELKEIKNLLTIVGGEIKYNAVNYP